MFLISAYFIFIIIKNILQIIPPMNTVKETPQTCERAQEIKLPKGIIPAKVNINTLITLPLILSLTMLCNKVLIIAMAITLEAPRKTRINKENR